MNKDKIIKFLQWLLIVLLSLACAYFWLKSDSSVITDGNYKKSDTQFVSISSDRTLKELRKTNNELYDSIKKLNDVKEAIQVKYVTRYKTGTVYVDKVIQGKDSTYHYSHNDDTIKYNLDINGNKVKWFKLNFVIQDSLMIVTRSKNGKNETTISHNPSTAIKDATVFVPKKTFSKKMKDRVYFGVGVGAGYGIINKKPDVYVGVNAGFKF